MLHGADIAQVLQSQGPVVTCVLLRHMRADAKDVKPHRLNSKVDATHKREVLMELIDEIQVDTTPSRSHIRELLGPFTFIGQFPTEGLMAMARRELPENISNLSISALREWCDELDVDTEGIIEKSELVQALEATRLPVNPHQLQPPLDKHVVRGDILLLKVAETEETLDEENDKDGEKEEKELKVMSNEEFFLNYTKEEYVAFASRTDVVAPTVESDEEGEDGEEEGEEQEEEDDDDDEDDGDYDPTEEGECTEEEEKRVMLNLIMAEVLRKFREDKGRGPSSEELLELRRQVAAPLGLEVTTVDDMKRPATEQDGDHEDRPSKRVKFNGSADGEGEGAADNDDDDQKPVATDDASSKNEKKESPTEAEEEHKSES